MPTQAELEAQIAALEGEIERLRIIEAAAREAYAFLAGRRPGFAADYARTLLQEALGIARAPQPRRGTRRKS